MPEAIGISLFGGSLYPSYFPSLVSRKVGMMFFGTSVKALEAHSPFFLHVHTAFGKDHDKGGFGNNLNDSSVYSAFHDSSRWCPCCPDINQHRSISIDQSASINQHRSVQRSSSSHSGHPRDHLVFPVGSPGAPMRSPASGSPSWYRSTPWF